LEGGGIMNCVDWVDGYYVAVIMRNDEGELSEKGIKKSKNQKIKKSKNQKSVTKNNELIKI
jgi:hypothetical protein